MKMQDYDIYKVGAPDMKKSSTPTENLGPFSKDSRTGRRREIVHKDDKLVEDIFEGPDNLVFKSDAVYVRGDSDARVSNGYYYAPYRTIAEALRACTSERNTIIILDNATYTGDVVLAQSKCNNIIGPNAHLLGEVINNAEHATIKLGSCTKLTLNKSAYVYIDDCSHHTRISDKVIHGYVGNDIYYKYSPTLTIKSSTKVTLVADTPYVVNYSNFDLYFPLTFDFLKIDEASGTATPVAVKYSFTSIAQDSWSATLTATEDMSVLVVARG